MTKQKKTGRVSPLMSFIVIILAVVLIVLVYIRCNITAIGTGIGKASGTIVGKVIGSAKGITEGRAQGTADGTAQGLSAEDTTAEVRSIMTAAGNLEVLVAEVSLYDVMGLGKVYEGLYLIEADAVFAVDLSQAEIEISEDGDMICIFVPEPELELFLDLENTQTLVEKQRLSWRVSSDDGFAAYLNSVAKIREKSEEAIVNYDFLVNAATESAQTQVTQLVSTVCGSSKVVSVEVQEVE